MPFEPGNQLNLRRKKRAGGPKSKYELDAMAKATEVFQKILTGKAEPIAHHYSRRIFKNDQVLLDARKKLWPDDIEVDSGQTLNIFIAQATKTAEPGLAPELRGNGIQVRIGGNNGQNGNGSDGA